MYFITYLFLSICYLLFVEIPCKNQHSEWVNWLFNVTINDISVIHVTAHTCAGGPKTTFDLRSMRHRFTIYSAFLHIRTSISWYQEIHFLISRNTFSDIKKCISSYQEFDFLISRIRFLDTFLDIKKIEFLISRNHFSSISWYKNVFWGAVLLFIQYSLISRIWFLDINDLILDIKKYNSWYQEMKFIS